MTSFKTEHIVNYNLENKKGFKYLITKLKKINNSRFKTKHSVYHRAFFFLKFQAKIDSFKIIDLKFETGESFKKSIFWSKKFHLQKNIKSESNIPNFSLLYH